LTWDHPRGYQPLEACALRWRSIEPDVTVRWERRSLKSFGDDPLDDLANRHDLIIIDHPFVGAIADAGCFVALDRYLDVARAVADRRLSWRKLRHVSLCRPPVGLPVDAAPHVSLRR